MHQPVARLQGDIGPCCLGLFRVTHRVIIKAFRRAGMNQNGRLVISGAVSEYNRAQPVGIRNTLDFISKRLRMEGLVVFDYARDFPKAQMEMAGWIMSGALTYKEEIIDGLDNAPTAFAALFDGSPVFGRRIVKV